MTKSDNALLIFVRGLPGSGKSHLTLPLSDAISRITGQPVTVLDPDATDYDSQAYHDHVARLTAEGVDPILHAYRFLRGQAYSAIDNRGVAIWNQPFTNLEIFNKMVGRMHEQAELSNAKIDILVVEVMIDVDEAKKRVEQRKAEGGHGPSDATFARFVNDFTSFESEGYQTVSVNGTDPVDASVSRIMEHIKPLLLG